MKAAVRAVLIACSLHNVAEAQRRFPVTKVAEMLQKMGQELEQDAETDAKMDSKMNCWCTSNKKEKEDQISTGEKETIPTLENTIATKKVEIVRLKTEISITNKQVEKAESSLKSSTDRRDGRRTDFQDREQELQANLEALTKAEDRVKSLPPKSTSFLSSRRTAVMQSVVEEVRRVHDRYTEKAADGNADDEKKLALQEQASKLAKLGQSGDGGDASYDVVQGVLGEMRITMARDLNNTQTQELSEIETFTGMKKAKEEEILLGQNKVAQKEKSQAEAEDVKATSDQQLSDAKDLLASNKKFYDDITEKCKEHEEAYQERKRTRNEEIAGVSKAVAILTQDSAKTVFSRTFNNGAFFLQLSSEASNAAEKVADLLHKASETAEDPKLAALATTVRKMGSAGGPPTFKKVFKALYKMGEQLLQKQEQEKTMKKNCDKDYAQNQADKEKYTEQNDSNSATQAKLKTQINEINVAVKTLEEEVAKNTEDLKDATANRKAENEAFIAAVKDQKATQALLQKAKETLEAIGYSATPAAPALVQKKAQQQPSDAPEGLADYARKASDGVMGLLETVLEESHTLEKESIEAEKAAAETYETFKADTQETIKNKQEEILSKNSEKSKATKELIEAEDNIDQAKTMLDNLKAGYLALEDECRYLLNNFDVRQKAYQTEMDALKTATGFLEGFSDKKVPIF